MKETEVTLNQTQFTEEMLGQAEKTALDAHLANRLGKAESTKRGAEKLMKQTEVPLNPNPGEGAISETRHESRRTLQPS
ncbi:endophilin-B1-like [Narcine bancroftii]|uniref:endophilin-B1-like n=1 Tax=Narcine bancroftii TaxID=1343680 RepID=UPI003831939A